MFSRRFGNDPESPNALWEMRMGQEAAGRSILDLTLSNPTLAGLPYPPGIPSRLGRAGIMEYRPDPRGSLAARQAVSDYYASKRRTVRPEDLVLTASTSEAYSFLFKLLCDPGDEILIPSPTYPLFDTLAGLEHVELVRYPLRMPSAEGNGGVRWRADFGFLRRQISTRCKALILVNPNNPTGHLCDAEEIGAYLELAAEYGLALIVDEVFSDYVLGDRPFVPILSDGPLVFTLNGFSKLLALPQLKLGWIHATGAIDAVRSALGHLECIADAFLSVNTPVQLAAGDLLRSAGAIQDGVRARLRANLAIAESLSGTTSRLRMLRPEAGWYAVADVAGRWQDEAFALALLERHHVYAHPGHLFGFETGCSIVISLLVPEADFREGLLRMAALAGEDPIG